MSIRADTRDQILQAALALAQENSGLTMAEIAARAGLSRQAVYLHFHDRTALLVADAIIGTGADAIIGTGADSVAHRGKVSSASSKRYLIASGPAEVLDAARGVIRVMGRTVSAPIDSNLFATVANAAGSGSVATVTIYGQVDSRGALSNAIAQPGSATYVPGASAIVVTDIVRSIDARTGTVLIGNLKVDYTAMLAVSAVPLKAGKVATIVGTQPQAGQAIIAQRIIAR